MSDLPSSLADSGGGQSARRLLLLDDDADVCRTVAQMGARLGAKIFACSTLAEFEAAIETFSPDILLIDLMMPGVDGIDVIARINPQCGAKIYVMTGADKRTLEASREVLRSTGAQISGFLQKPFSVMDLRRVLNQIKLADASDPVSLPAISEAGLLSPSDFEKAVKRGLVAPYFQPIFYAGGNRLKGFEALLRVTGQGTTHFASQYLEQLVHDDALSITVTNDVIERSLNFLALLRPIVDLTISINIFGKHAAADGFRDSLVKSCLRYGAAPNCVILELSEATIFDLNDEDLRKITQLRLAGFGLSIDDFGTGNSSLGRLARLPFSELKIDKSFCLDLPGSESAEAVIEACLGIARKLDMQVTAEGVESREVAAKLSGMGCHALQGHYFGRAMPADQVVEWINKGYPKAVA